VCFAVLPTALRATFCLIDMYGSYPVAHSAIWGSRDSMGPNPTAILDIDGTLVDTNYHHAIAWQRALRAHGHTVPAWRIHRHIGMGGDQIVTALTDQEVEDSEGDSIRDAEGEAYSDLIGEVAPLAGARELIAELHDDGWRMVLASSAKADEVDHYLDLLEVRDLVEWTTSADVEATKPAPDLVRVALAKVGGDGAALMIGDSVWDVKAASNASVPTLAVLSGGFSAAELHEAGAAEVVESVAEMCSAGAGDGPLQHFLAHL